jgi:hypothetical protein
MRNFLLNALAILYFLVLMVPSILMLLLVVLFMLTDIYLVLKIGYPRSNAWIFMASLFSLIVGISTLVPAFRRMYRIFPWLFACVRMFLYNLLILSAALWLVNYGYEVQNDARHGLFAVITILLIVICRLAMSIYFHYRPARFAGGDGNDGR